MIDVFILASLADWFAPHVLWNIALVCLLLGFTIFIHEFGHFIVAKACGVKCEKFYVGFDFFGWKIFSFQWGETEYGMGIFPLGGYVKMLGQEDNPGELRDEFERSKLAVYRGEPDAPSEEEYQQQREVVHDPRSFLAKPVWQRMAIIVAGVTMNAIFAFVAGILAFSIGIPELAPEIGQVSPGSGAWKAGLNPGDTVVAINDKPVVEFGEVQAGIALADNIKDGLKMKYIPAGSKEVKDVVIELGTNGLNPIIGILPASDVTLFPTGGIPGTPATRAFYSSEQKNNLLEVATDVVEVNGQPVNSNQEILKQLRIHRSEPVELTLASDSDKTEPRKFTVEPQLMRGFGLIMKMGPIVGVRAGSPAEKAGIKEGDMITRIDDQLVSDPYTLPQIIENKVYETIDGVRTPVTKTLRLEIQRPLELKEEEINARDPFQKLNLAIEIAPAEHQIPTALSDNVSINELGLAYEIANEVAYVVPGSPAAEAGIETGTKFESYRFIAPNYPKDAAQAGVKEKIWEKNVGDSDVTTMSDTKPNWAGMMYSLQFSPEGTSVAFDTDKGEYSLKTMDMPGIYTDMRGLRFMYKQKIVQADSFGEAVSKGSAKTGYYFTLVVQMVKKLFTNQVSMKGLAGPVGMAQMAYQSADNGLGTLFLFTCLISANLAVLNLLPIPVVDGGHVVFLAWEWITGTPPPQTLMVILSYMGLFLLLALFAWTLLLDCKFIPRF